MTNRGRNTGNTRPREYASPPPPPPKKRFLMGGNCLSPVDDRVLDVPSPVSGSSTVTSTTENSERSYEDARGCTEGAAEGGKTAEEMLQAQKESMREMFEAWYETRCHTTLPVLETAEVISTPDGANRTGAKGTWKQVWTAKCEERLPYLYDVCTPQFVEAAILSAVMKVGWNGYMGQNTQPTLNDSVKHASSWINGLKFSKTPGSGKKSWGTEGGKIQILLRESVIREVVRRIESDAVAIMEKIKKKKEGTTGEIEGNEIPEWMEPGFIKPADVRAIIEGKIGTGSSQGRRLRTKKVEREDAARHVVKIIYEQLSKTLTSARRRVDDAFYAKSGHLYVDWSKHPVVGSGRRTYVNQENMLFKFPKEADEVLQEGLSGIPVASIMDGEKTVRAVDRENAAKYRIVEEKLEDLYMIVHHEGLEKVNGDWGRKRGHKTVRFLPLALQMLLTFSFGACQERLFRSHPSSFQKLSGFACLLYAMALEYDEVRGERDVVEDLNEVSIGALRLAQLLPCDYRCREVIRKGGCLTW